MTAEAATAKQPTLEVVDLKTHFFTKAGVVKAVDGVSFSIAPGEVLGLVGESGCGKSMTGFSIIGLIDPPGRIVSGAVRFKGRDLAGLAEEELRMLRGNRISMIFQDPMMTLNPVLRIDTQMIETIQAHRDCSRSVALGLARNGLVQMGISSPERRLRCYPHELSGGMRQRVVIAIALACGPELLFADEPTTALDVTVQAQILDLLDEQQRERDMAMVLVSHDLGVVAGRTHDIAVMYAGQIVEQAPTATLFSEVRMPYTEALLKSVPRLENASHTRLAVIGGRPPDLIDPPPGCRFAPRCPYAQARCHVEQPPLIEADTPGHFYRCWYPVGTDAGREALERNLAEHLPQAEAAVTGELSPELETDLVAADVVVADAPAGGNGQGAAVDGNGEGVG
jgi:peptide/nickel transport system ATP-binding protein